MSTPSSLSRLEDRFGQRIALRLSEDLQELPHDIGERLRAARVQALAHRKIAYVHTAPGMLRNGATAALSGGWWMRIGSVLPVLALIAGLVFISIREDERRANEIAEVDAALLSSDLPPAAYTDPGFAQFLKER